MRLFSFMVCCTFHLYVLAYQDTLTLGKQIDSLLALNTKTVDLNSYQFYQTILKDSEKLNYSRGVLQSCIKIITYQTKNGNLDSLFHYSQKFEKYQSLCPDQKLKLDYLYTVGYGFLYRYNLPEYALPYYVEALRLCKEDDFDKKFSLNKGIVDSYIYKGQYDLVIEQVNKMLEDSAKTTIEAKNFIKGSLAIAYQQQERPDKSGPILKSIIKEAAEEKDSLQYTFAKVYQGYNLYLENKYNSSIDSLNSTFKLLKKHWPRGLINHYEFLSMSYAKLGNYKKASHLMKKATTASPIAELPKLYSHLANYHIQLGNKDSALYYNNQKSLIIDSIRKVEKKVYVDFYKVKLDFINTVQENKNIKLKQIILAKENRKQRYYITILFISTICLIIGVIAFMFYKKNKKSEKELNILKRNEKRTLENHIRLRENELSAILIGQSNKMKELKEIKDQVHEAIDERTSGKIKKTVLLLDKFLKTTTSDEILTERIESQYPGLVLQLQDLYPQLSKTDIRHCLLIKLGLSIKESADLLNVNPNTVKTARYRAKSKLKLPEDLSLKDFLESNLSYGIPESY
ncbi:hypothetical protein NBT05_09180 [Aquimarina sp. ERC-38]|uniref:hypothetical protein n=1 Tax=Aquimarina sp. ERC-38 TaxID=2949996 RepID=UPI0022471A7D|nr:hypothetical protein [Aquimarina sp. ERC-38]UZO79143.1 hypothetical protein NBT05_09180 [Aquimarina sp. ERC-38]